MSGEVSGGLGGEVEAGGVGQLGKKNKKGRLEVGGRRETIYRERDRYVVSLSLCPETYYCIVKTLNLIPSKKLDSIT